jgi:endonuclease/exonuclease/phosphatase family metal-dependent hydrolase
MKVMTFNIWNYTRPWKQRRALIAELIEQHRPQAIALQETRHDFRYEHGKGQGEQLAEMTGYHATVAVGQVYLPILRVDEAVTILTRERPAKTVQRELTKLPRERADENQRVCLGVLLQVNGQDFYVFDTHFSLSARARLSNAMETSRFIKEVSRSSPAVVMGDLNAEPHTPEIRFLHGEYSHAGETGDFFDCWTSANPDDPGFTYASSGPVRRIDYAFARNLPTSGISAQIIGGEAKHGVYPSDHLGMVLDLPLP